MPSPRILILAPWPFRTPRNGGQLRADAIVRAYKSSGFSVRTASIFDRGRTQTHDVWPDDIPFMQGVIDIMQRAPTKRESSELKVWEAVAAAQDSFAAFSELVRTFKPNAIQFEEPFLWPVIRRLRADGLLRDVPIIHSSHNFETTAWRDLQIAGAKVSAATLREIAEVEQDIALHCESIVTVSEHDALEFRALGAANVNVALNGTSFVPTSSKVSLIDAFLAQAPYALFVSSRHPPNAHGLVELAASSSNCLLKSGEVLIAGTVGTSVRNARRFKHAQKILSRSRYLGWIADDLRDGLYERSRVVLLPKTLGGGSNLKTAEALASGRPIVATSLAMRGFESFSGLPGITIADEANGFWSAVNCHLETPWQPPLRDATTMATLTWNECLRPMVASTLRLLD